MQPLSATKCALLFLVFINLIYDILRFFDFKVTSN